ncbi:MAG: rod shape-determining protein [Thermotogae bacterium]|nr:rod shape-determining protein [Thermotogota bacterium]
MRRLSIDIGTRTVVGICSEFQGDRIKVSQVFTVEHAERAMLDGAIHDIEKVAEVVRKVKGEIESRAGEKFKSADVALAGRFLQTVIGEAALRLDRLTEITSQTVKHLEAMATKEAVAKLQSEREMYCVGYSPLFYTVDGEWIRNPVGHRASEVYVKVMATFLPRHIVDSMVLALKRADLHVGHLTLEPIAVLELLVPQDLRLLNLVILDVGAGTSDIAISKDGMVIGYAMIPNAGDEITEEICKNHLLDFQTAETVKRKLAQEAVITARDILGFETEFRSEELIREIEPVIDNITEEIAERIVSLNGRPPAAVLVVGGGAKVPGFTERLALKLDLPKNRVSLRSVESLDVVEDSTGELRGSEFITPVAIALAGHKFVGGVFISVTLNGKPVQLLPLGEKRSVLDLLLQNGYSLNEVIAKPAPSIVYEVNGELRIHRGERGKDAPVYINGKEASLRSTVEHGDEVVIGTPVNGHLEPLRIKDVIPCVEVECSGEIVRVYPPVTIDGVSADLDTTVEDSMKIEHPRSMKVREILQRLPKSQLKISVSGRYLTLDAEEYQPVEKELEDEVTLGERLSVVKRRKVWRVRDVLKIPEDTITVHFNGEPVNLPTSRVFASADGTPVDLDTPIEDGMTLEVRTERVTPSVVDLLARRTIDPSRIREYKILVNGEPAEFTRTLNEDDEIIFEYWEIV